MINSKSGTERTNNANGVLQAKFFEVVTKLETVREGHPRTMNVT